MFWLLESCGLGVSNEKQVALPKSLTRHVPKRLLPHLFMGSPRDAADVETLRTLGIKYIVNVSPIFAPGRCVYPTDFGVLEAGMEGRYIHSLIQCFGEIEKYIEGLRQRKERVCVVCFSGYERSAVICILYLVSNHPDVSVQDCIRQVTQHIPISVVEIIKNC